MKPGMILLITGVVYTLLGAVTDSSHSTNIGLLAMINGILFMRVFKVRPSPKAKQQSKQNQADTLDTLTSLKQIVSKLEFADSKIALTQLEQLKEKHILPLHHQRQTMHAIYGKQSLALILQLAQIERLLNRIQSAALDGYIGEARNSYNDLVQIAQQIKIPAS